MPCPNESHDTLFRPVGKLVLHLKQPSALEKNKKAQPLEYWMLLAEKFKKKNI
jgi:hypothetical protein